MLLYISTVLFDFHYKKPMDGLIIYVAGTLIALAVLFVLKSFIYGGKSAGQTYLKVTR